MQNVLRSNSCKVCWFGFRKVEVLVVVLSSAVYYGPTVVEFMSAVNNTARNYNEEDYCG